MPKDYFKINQAALKNFFSDETYAYFEKFEKLHSILFLNMPP